MKSSMPSTKKIIFGVIGAFVILFFIGVFLAGVGLYSYEQATTPKKETTTQQTGQVTETQQRELILNVGETAKTSKIKVTVFSVEKTDYYVYTSGGFSGSQVATPNKIFVLVDAEIQNIGSDSVYVGSSEFSLSDSEGYRYDPEIYLGEDRLDLFKQLYQNQKMRGKILFEIPENASGLKLHYDFGNLFIGTKLATWIIR
jgi:hypothetical protein